MPKKTNLSVKQQAFINEYIKNKGNATKAAIKAGYSEKTAAVIGVENLRKPNMQAELGRRLNSSKAKKVAQADEILELLTKFARGKAQEETVVILTDKMFDEKGRLSNITTKPEIFKKKIVPKDQLTALDKLARIHGLYNDKVEVKVDKEDSAISSLINALGEREVEVNDEVIEDD